MMAWLKNLNWVDILIIILLLRGVVLGVLHGFARECANFFKLIFSLTISFFCYPFLAKVINISNILSFILIYLAVYFLFNLLMKVRKRDEISFSRRIAGGCIGLLKGAIIAFFALLFLNFLPLSSLNTAVKDKSLFAPYLLDNGNKIWQLIRNNSAEIIKDDRVSGN